MFLPYHSLISRFPSLSLENSGSKFFNQKKCILMRYLSKLDILIEFFKTLFFVYFWFVFFFREEREFLETHHVFRKSLDTLFSFLIFYISVIHVIFFTTSMLPAVNKTVYNFLQHCLRERSREDFEVTFDGWTSRSLFIMLSGVLWSS